LFASLRGGRPGTKKKGKAPPRKRRGERIPPVQGGTITGKKFKGRDAHHLGQEAERLKNGKKVRERRGGSLQGARRLKQRLKTVFQTKPGPGRNREEGRGVGMGKKPKMPKGRATGRGDARHASNSQKSLSNKQGRLLTRGKNSEASQKSELSESNIPTRRETKNPRWKKLGQKLSCLKAASEKEEEARHRKGTSSKNRVEMRKTGCKEKMRVFHRGGKEREGEPRRDIFGVVPA